jgi:hypothetical protein
LDYATRFTFLRVLNTKFGDAGKTLLLESFLLEYIIIKND